MTTAAATTIRRDPTIASIPRLLGYTPSESVVLVPLRDGAPTGALRFSLTPIDPVPAARAFIGVLGRFGRTDAALAALYTERPRLPSTIALLEALRSQADRLGLGDLEVLTGHSEERGFSATASRLASGPVVRLPAVPREEVLAVAGEVDALLDRHPSAELPKVLRSRAEAALDRACAGHPERLRFTTTAALIVCAQRDEWSRAALARVSNRTGCDLDAVTALVASAAACAPASEQASVLVLLAALHLRTARLPEARALVGRAVRMDPHGLPARRLLAALESADDVGGALLGRRAA